MFEEPRELHPFHGAPAVHGLAITYFVLPPAVAGEDFTRFMPQGDTVTTLVMGVLMGITAVLLLSRARQFQPKPQHPENRSRAGVLRFAQS